MRARRSSGDRPTPAAEFLGQSRRRKSKPSFVAEGMCLTGGLTATGVLRIGGEVHGDISCAGVTIDNTAWIAGNVTAASVVVMGRVDGDITAEDLVLGTGSEVRGRIRYGSLRLEKGSFCAVAEPILHDGELVINGHIVSDLRCKTLILGEAGRVEGNVIASQAQIDGHVIGTIFAPTVVLGATAHVIGDIYHRGLSFQRGAYFEGKARRVEDPLRLAPR